MGSTARPRRSYSKTAERKRRIVEAAAGVFAERGYQAGSYQEIADRVGVSQSSLSHHFPTKPDLLLAVLQWRDDMSRAPHGGGDPRAFARQLLGQAERNAAVPGLVELYTVLAGESVTKGHPATPYIVERFSRLRADYRGDLEELAAAGALRDGVDPARAAASVVALWDGIQLQAQLDPDIDVIAVMRDYLRAILVLDDVE